MRTVILHLTYANDIDHSTVEALVDSHTQDEGVVAVSASQVTEPYVRILDGEEDEDEREQEALETASTRVYNGVHPCSSRRVHSAHQYISGFDAEKNEMTISDCEGVPDR